jgi:chromosome segregation ATPase
VQCHKRRQDVRSAASEAREGVEMTQEQVQQKQAQVDAVQHDMATLERSEQQGQEEIDELTKKHAQLDIDIKDCERNQHNSENDKVCA